MQHPGCRFVNLRFASYLDSILQIDYPVVYKIIPDLQTFSILFQWNIGEDAEKESLRKLLMGKYSTTLKY